MSKKQPLPAPEKALMILSKNRAINVERKISLLQKVEQELKQELSKIHNQQKNE